MAWTLTIGGGGTANAAKTAPYPGGDLDEGGQPLIDPTAKAQAFLNSLVAAGHSIQSAQIVVPSGTILLPIKRSGN